VPIVSAATLSDFVGRSAGPRGEKLQDWQSGELKNAGRIQAASRYARPSLTGMTKAGFGERNVSEKKTGRRPALRRNVTDRSLPPSGRYPRKCTQPILGSLMAPWFLLRCLISAPPAEPTIEGQNRPSAGAL
jgi:hypothetical protein